MTDPRFEDEKTLVSGQAGGRRSRLLRPGDVVGGSYEIISQIGRGGMGIVYKALHRAVHREVALKALAPEHVDQNNWARFQTEGKAIASLDHRNIVRVYDMGADGADCLFYVMDFLDGISLAEQIRKKGVLPLLETLDIFEQLCAGLDYAHRQGLVHRDVKPTNVILCGGAGGAPLVKLIDFGLVKLLGENDRFKQSQTATGQVCGSPLYMSPEQCLGGRIDARSDIYSLGCAMYECLVGLPPFCGKTGLETASMHKDHKVPMLRQERPEKKYPENLEEVVCRMLAKIPAQRYQSMAQVAEDLRRVRDGKSVSRASAFVERPLIEADEATVASLEDARRAPAFAFKWLAILAAIAVFIFGGFACMHFFKKDDSEKVNKALIGTSPVPEVTLGQPETEEIKEARRVYAEWPTISQGIVSVGTVPKRLFKFPPISLGLLCWGPDWQYKTSAAGEVMVPADAVVGVELLRPESRFTRLFPSILEKIGPEDVSALGVIEHDGLVEGSSMSYEVPPGLFKAVAGWKKLRKLIVQSCRLTPDAIAAMNELQNVTDLSLRDTLVDGKNLRHLRWLKQLEHLDLRATQNVCQTLEALAGSPNLADLSLDRTDPSKAALEGLVDCPKLVFLGLCETEIDDEKLAVVCRISKLRYLNLKRCVVTRASLPMIAKLKHLEWLNLQDTDLLPADVAWLRKQLPHCDIDAGKIKDYRL